MAMVSRARASVVGVAGAAVVLALLGVIPGGAAQAAIPSDGLGPATRVADPVPLDGAVEQGEFSYSWSATGDGVSACDPATLEAYPDCDWQVLEGSQLTARVTFSTTFIAGNANDTHPNTGHVSHCLEPFDWHVVIDPAETCQWHYDVQTGSTVTDTWTVTYASEPVGDETFSGAHFSSGLKLSAGVMDSTVVEGDAPPFDRFGPGGRDGWPITIASVYVGTPAPVEKPPNQAPIVAAVPFDSIVALTAPTNGQSGVVTYPITVQADASDDSGTFQLLADVYSGGRIVSGQALPQVADGRHSFTIDRKPSGKGPFYICIWARDGEGLNSGQRNACVWLAMEVPLEDVSNGCGSSSVVKWSKKAGEAARWVQNFLGNKRHYGADTVKVDKACDVHDAGYAGLTVLDPVRGRYVDFRSKSRLEVDKHFLRDVQLACRQQLTGPAARKWLGTCESGLSEKAAKKRFAKLLEEFSDADVSDPDRGDSGAPGPVSLALAWDRIEPELGAETYMDIVRGHGRPGYDTDATAIGDQEVTPSGGTTPSGGNRDNS